MVLSKDTEEVLKFLDYTSGNNLRKRNDLGIILETGAAFGLDSQINDLCFYGKTLWSLYNTLKKRRSSDEGFSSMEREFKTTAAELISLLSQFKESFEENEIISRFETVYLAADSGAMRNIIDLCHDLAELKSIQIKLKQSGNSQ